MNENQLVKINPIEFGLQATEAAQVEAVFMSMIEKMRELEDEFNEIAQLPIEPTTCQRAKKLRLQFVKIRTGTAEIHKKAKAFYLAGSRFVDAWKNAQLMASGDKEKALEKIERHFEILEAERKEKLKTERIGILSELCESPEMYPVAEISEQAFNQLIEGLKAAKLQREEAEKKAREEQERIERVNTDRRNREFAIRPYIQFYEASEDLGTMEQETFNTLLIGLEKAKKEYDAKQERIRIENEHLKEEARKAEEERKRKEEEIRKERERIENERKEAEEKARKDREAIEAKVRSDERAKAEREKDKLRLKAECDKKKAEEEREAERLEKERLEKIIADTITCPKCRYSFLISENGG